MPAAVAAFISDHLGSRRDGAAERRLLCLRRRAARRRRGAGADRGAGHRRSSRRRPLPLAAAAGRILARDLVAGMDVPPHANSAVDGFAIAHADLLPDRETVLPVTGRAAAGHPLGRPIAPRRGDPHLHRRADAGRRRYRDDAGGLRRRGRPGAAQARHQEGRQPPPCRRGRRQGQRLRCPPGGGCGRPISASPPRSDTTTLPVFRPLRVALLSTGDEVCEPGTRARRRARSTTPTASCWRRLLRGLGCAVSDLGIRPDRAAALADTLAEAAAGHDLIVTSGGVSTGEEDHVRAGDREARAARFLAAGDQARAAGRARAGRAACR